MSADSSDDPFFMHVRELLLTLDDEEEETEEQQHEENKEENEEEEQDEELTLDPYNPHHIEWMQQFIMNHYKTSLTDNNTENKRQCLSGTDTIYTIIIKEDEYINIDEFNHYLSSILLNMLKYADIHNELYHIKNNKYNENNKKRKRRHRSSYDEMMQHIPPQFIPSLNPSSSYTAGISQKYIKSKIFRSTLMENQNIEIISTLQTLKINHCVDIKSLKLIHDIVQLSKQSLLNISLQFKLYDDDYNKYNKYNDNEQDIFYKMWQQRHSTQSLQNLQSLSSSQISYQRYGSNMMISCISSILKLCERMINLEIFSFHLIDFNRECYDYFTHFDTDSDVAIFPNLKSLTIHIDDHLSQTEVSSFPFYAFAASPILAFLKKLSSLQSICIIIDDKYYESKTENNNDDNIEQYQFTIYWIKKLCEKLFEILNKSHRDLKYFYFKNIRSDCGTSEFFMEMLVNFIKNHTELIKINIILHDLCDENLANLVESMYYTDSKMKFKACFQCLEELKLCSKTCVDYYNDHRSLRHHYGDISLSALLHLIYMSHSLHYLSLICFYGADTIKFNALISAIKHKDCINRLEIAQLRKDNDTLYSLSKLFKPYTMKKKSHYKLNWNFYESVVISFGVEFSHFYHGERLKIYDMKKFIDLILKNQLLLQQSKINLLNLISIKTNKYLQIFIPNDILWIIVEFSLGLDSLNVLLLEWNLFDGEELYLLFQILKYFKIKYNQLLINQHNHYGMKQIHRKIEWFHPNWSQNVIDIDK